MSESRARSWYSSCTNYGVCIQSLSICVHFGYVETVLAYNLHKNVFTDFCELDDFWHFSFFFHYVWFKLLVYHPPPGGIQNFTLKIFLHTEYHLLRKLHPQYFTLGWDPKKIITYDFVYPAKFITGFHNLTPSTSPNKNIEPLIYHWFFESEVITPGGDGKPIIWTTHKTGKNGVTKFVFSNCHIIRSLWAMDLLFSEMYDGTMKELWCDFDSNRRNIRWDIEVQFCNLKRA